MPSAKMSFEELQTAVQILASVLTQHQVVFGIMGGAGIALIASHYGRQQPRATAELLKRMTQEIFQPTQSRRL